MTDKERSDIAWHGLANIYSIITGKTCKNEAALGMATSAVAQLMQRIAELEAALAREQNGRKETLHTLDGLTEKLAETRAAPMLATDALRRILGLARTSGVAWDETWKDRYQQLLASPGRAKGGRG